ncbi:MAG: hypothetical protein FWF02_12845 [Micrococcales bacterium]|nr:hypothetical protein [Micrococcales bacterium]MCL2668561.1 hypothetical protein [Micrococcales bacterium]
MTVQAEPALWETRLADLTLQSARGLDTAAGTAINAGFVTEALGRLTGLMGEFEVGHCRGPETRVEAPTDPALYEALAVARARLEMAKDPAWRSSYEARYWLDEADRLSAARGARLDEVLDVRALRAQVDAPPQVVDGRFAPDPTTGFGRDRWVVCSRCGRPGVEHRTVWWRSWTADDGQFTCLGCGARDSCTGFPSDVMVDPGPIRARRLLLMTEVGALGTLWVDNRHHLDQLRCYITATVRDERAGLPRSRHYTCCYPHQGSWYVALPTWVKTAKNRPRVLKAVARLMAIADKSGLG